MSSLCVASVTQGTGSMLFVTFDVSNRGRVGTAGLSRTFWGSGKSIRPQCDKDALLEKGEIKSPCLLHKRCLELVLEQMQERCLELRQGNTDRFLVLQCLVFE